MANECDDGGEVFGGLAVEMTLTFIMVHLMISTGAISSAGSKPKTWA
jgi:hypothetical protein